MHYSQRAKFSTHEDCLEFLYGRVMNNSNRTFLARGCNVDLDTGTEEHYVDYEEK